MTVSSTSLPIVIIFEDHLDSTPKKLLQLLTPKLSEIGYNTLCLEVDCETKEEKIISAFRKNFTL